MCKSETLSAYLIYAYVCSICFNIAWVDWDSGPHFFTKMNQFVWSETQADFVAALCEIFHKRCAQPKMDFSQFTSLEPCRNGWQKEEFHIRVWIDDIEIPKCQHAQCFAFGSLQKSWSLGLSLQLFAQQNTSHRTRIFALMFWVFPQKCHCWKLMTCWCKTTRPDLCKKVLPKFLEFILNLVKLVIWQPWRNAVRNAEARSHVLVQGITFQICWNRSFPARPSKISISIEWCGWALRCIVFGVVVELGTPRISNPTAFVACCSDHICRTHLATFEWAVYGGLAQHFTPQRAVPMLHWIAGIQRSLREVLLTINLRIGNGFCSWTTIGLLCMDAV